MALRTKTYPATGTVDDLSRTCGGHEDAFRGPLKKLERVTNTAGKKGTRATYEEIPMDKEYTKQELFIFDVTTAEQEQKVASAQLALGRAEAFRGEVFLNDKPAVVAVYRKKL